jgi:NADH:ubiquinone oxidoreductase subunit E
MAKHHIKICLGSSCFSRGNNVNVEVVKKFLREHTLEAEVTFSGRLCEDMCNRGPVIVIDDRVYEDVNLSRLHKILEEEFKC